jgi:hypothetical protein
MSELQDTAKIALVGFYGRGNFGDDLLSIIWGLSLRRAGVDFSIYKLPLDLANRFGFKSEHSIAADYWFLGLLLFTSFYSRASHGNLPRCLKPQIGLGSDSVRYRSAVQALSPRS